MLVQQWSAVMCWLLSCLWLTPGSVRMINRCLCQCLWDLKLMLRPLVPTFGAKVNKSFGVMVLFPCKMFQYWIRSALRRQPWTENKFSFLSLSEYGNYFNPSTCFVHLFWTCSSFCKKVPCLYLYVMRCDDMFNSPVQLTCWGSPDWHQCMALTLAGTGGGVDATPPPCGFSGISFLLTVRLPPFFL